MTGIQSTRNDRHRGSVIDTEYFFRVFIEPLKKEVAEMGAFAGVTGRDMLAAEARIKEMVRAALARAGVGSTARLEHARTKFNRSEEFRRSLSARFQSAGLRLVGSERFASTRIAGRVVEGFADLLVIPGAPVILAIHWPHAALAQWRLDKAEWQERAVTNLREAAEGHLMAVFGSWFDRGETAAQFNGRPARAGSPQLATVPVPQNSSSARIKSAGGSQ